MKALKLSSYIVGVAIAGVGIAMAVTNPGQDAYEDYAVEQLSNQLDERVCNSAPPFLTDVCGSVLSENRDWIQDLVTDNTQRQNFIVISRYTTDLSTNDVIDQILPASISVSVDDLPSYHFETIGAFGQFYTYKAKRNE